MYEGRRKLFHFIKCMKGEPKSFTEYFIDDTVEKNYNEATAFL